MQSFYNTRIFNQKSRAILAYSQLIENEQDNLNTNGEQDQDISFTNNNDNTLYNLKTQLNKTLDGAFNINNKVSTHYQTQKTIGVADGLRNGSIIYNEHQQDCGCQMDQDQRLKFQCQSSTEDLKRLQDESNNLKQIQLNSINDCFDKLARMIQMIKQQAIDKLTKVYQQNDFNLLNYKKLINDQNFEINQTLEKVENIELLEDYQDKYALLSEVLDQKDLVQRNKKLVDEIGQVKLIKGVYITNNEKIKDMLNDVEELTKVITSPLRMNDDQTQQLPFPEINCNIQPQQIKRKTQRIQKERIYSTSTVVHNQNQKIALLFPKFSNLDNYINGSNSTNIPVSTVTTQRQRQASKSNAILNPNAKEYLQRLEMLSDELKSYNQYSDSNLLSETQINGDKEFNLYENINKIVEAIEDEDYNEQQYYEENDSNMQNLRVSGVLDKLNATQHL
eukprot:403374026